MKSRLRFACAILGLLALVLLAGIATLKTLPGEWGSHHNKGIISDGIIIGTLRNLDLCGSADPEAVNQMIGTNQESLALNRAISTLFKSKAKQLLDADVLVSTNGLILDAWGSPLLFAGTNNNSVFLRLPPQLRDTSRAVVVWSAGANRTNDFGRGDDRFPLY